MSFVGADFVVFGGGPAGAAAAIGLARQNARVVLFERGGSMLPKPGEIVEASVQRPLRELGVWEEFLKLRPMRSAGTLSAWNSEETIEANSMRNPWGGGFLIDRSAFEAFLLEQACAAGVRVVSAVAELEGPPLAGRRPIRWRDESDTFEARPAMYVEATGRAGGVASPNRRERHDDLVAMLCYRHKEENSDCRDLRLHIEAAPDGWWYAAALPLGNSVTAFLTDAQHVPRGASARRQFFVDQLKATRLMGEGYDGAPVGQIRVAPANSSIRRQLHGSDWVAVGDAAAAYDPLAGIGVVASLSKGVAIARLLVREPSTTSAARRYAELEREGFQNYLAGRRTIYNRHDRWKDRPFWAARTSQPLAV
jgi:flavin-dependent dehydrogenase